MPSRKRWRENPPLPAADFKDLARVKRHALLSTLRSAQNVCQLSKIKDPFKSSTTPDDVDKTFHALFRCLLAAGLGELGRRSAGALKPRRPR
eukprot:11162409-Lingulodinium_polyedra.AAC.1